MRLCFVCVCVFDVITRPFACVGVCVAVALFVCACECLCTNSFAFLYPFRGDVLARSAYDHDFVCLYALATKQ